MATPTDLSVLLRLYTGKQNSPSVSLTDFCDYLQKYARHYLQEAPELVSFLDNTENTVLKELEKLETESKIIISSDHKGHKHIFVPQFYIDRFSNRYKEIEERIEIPYPLPAELPSQFPTLLIKQAYISSDLQTLMENTERSPQLLYQLSFPDETAPILYPGNMLFSRLLDLSLSKIRMFLRKDESRDYIQKRIMVANPGKEISIKNYLTQFQTRPTESLESFKHSGEAFLFWSYMCSFIRQDYAKKTEKTPEEIALIQSIYIVEYSNNYFKTSTQQELQKETALKNLELAFQKAPYFFDMDAITRFTDSRGIPLLGQYKNVDLETFIKTKTGDPESHNLPDMLVFKTPTGQRYFLLKEKLYPLIIRLSNETRKTLKEVITQEWKALLLKFRQSEDMNNQASFEKKIEQLCLEHNPILHSVLTASFIPLLALEIPMQNTETPSSFKIFNHGRLLPWSELLMLDRHELFTDSRILLPFWYTIPIVSSLIAFFRRPRKKKIPIEKQHSLKTLDTQDKEAEPTTTSQKDVHEKQRQDLKQAALAVEKKIIPSDSTIEKEMNVLLDHWNRNLDNESKNNLTEDVKSLIRDYMRKTLRTLRASTFNLDRINNLAEILVDTPSLSKIKNREALLAYTRLYIIYLIRNLK